MCFNFYVANGKRENVTRDENLFHKNTTSANAVGLNIVLFKGKKQSPVSADSNEPSVNGNSQRELFSLLPETRLVSIQSIHTVENHPQMENKKFFWGRVEKTTS